MAGVKGQTQQRGVDRRAAIVDAAFALFSETGFRSGGLVALAERVGVTGPAILHHFGSKDNLLLAVIEKADRGYSAMSDTVYEPGGLETIRRLRLIAVTLEARPNLAALHLRLEVEHLLGDTATTRDYFLKRARASRRMLATAVAVGQDRGEIDRDLDPRALGEEMHAFIDGASRAWLVDRQLSIVAMVDGYLDALVARIAVTPPTRVRPT